MLWCLPYFRAVLCAVLIYTTSSSYGQILTTWPCHAVSENAPTPNYYFSYDPVSNSWSEVGMTNTTSSKEPPSKKVALISPQRGRHIC